MVEQPTTKAKTDPKKTVKGSIEPKLKKTGGDFGAVVSEGLQLVEEKADKALDDIRSLRTEASAAKTAANNARDNAEQAVNTSDRAVNLATDAKEKIEQAIATTGEAATKQELRSVKGRLKTAEDSLKTVEKDVADAKKAMTYEVSVPDENGRLQKQKKQGTDLFAHIMEDIQTTKDAVNGFGDQLANMAKDQELATKVQEAISNIDGKLQLLTMFLAKEITLEEIREQIETPSWDEKG